MNWIDKLERRWGNLGIPYLINGLMVGQLVVGLIALLFNWQILFAVSLNIWGLLSGQVWRLVTFLFEPIWIGSVLGVLNLVFYFWTGNVLTRYWGDFRMTLFIALGVLGAWVSCFVAGGASPSGIYISLLFAYAWMWPNQGVLLWGLVPFKMKYLGWYELILWAWQFITGDMGTRVSLILCQAGFLAFFGRELLDWCKETVTSYKRRKDWNDRYHR